MTRGGPEPPAVPKALAPGACSEDVTAAMPMGCSGDAKAVMLTAAKLAVTVPELQCHGGDAHGGTAHGNNPTMVTYTAVVPKVALPQ